MIYFVESIPGGGKSSYARKLYKKSLNSPIYYKEEYYNPIDLLRQAVLTKDEYEYFVLELDKSFENKEIFQVVYNEIVRAVTTLEDKVFLPFVHIRTDNMVARKLLDSLYEKEADDGKIALEQYCELIFKRIKKFTKDYDEKRDYIFEGALFHNPLFSFLGFYSVNYEKIRRFYMEIYTILKMYDYSIELLMVDDVDAIVKKTAENRKESAEFDWKKGFEKWFSQTLNYKGKRGIDGIIDFAKEIMEYEKRLVRDIPFKKNIIERRMN